MSTSLPPISSIGPSDVQSNDEHSDTQKQQNMPPKKGKVMRDVHPPLWRTPLWKVIYALSIGVFVLSMFYTWRLTQLKAQAGGWVNLLMGRHPNDPIPSAAEFTDSAKSSSGARPILALEDRIRDLADELGIHPREFASAIRPLLPTASVTSIAAANPTDPALSILSDDEHISDQGNNHDTLKAAVHHLAGIMGADDPEVNFE